MKTVPFARCIPTSWTLLHSGPCMQTAKVHSNKPIRGPGLKIAKSLTRVSHFHTQPRRLELGEPKSDCFYWLRNSDRTPKISSISTKMFWPQEQISRVNSWNFVTTNHLQICLSWKQRAQSGVYFPFDQAIKASKFQDWKNQQIAWLFQVRVSPKIPGYVGTLHGWGTCFVSFRLGNRFFFRFWSFWGLFKW